ncbi:hypothetical protein H2200_003217 [Cladophialophora chaetospira]|uniref:Uncharacterized protein n=1 Tax=Cladophialophora chaetospira TaxID=386627 RepID=A0AA38XGX9_9EURO|nr:hypothetical protein H2200_003217 [Cladophialophora chaetospira]
MFRTTLSSILLLSLLSITTALSFPSHLLHARQTNTNTTTDLSDPSCAAYSRIANLSTVGANATYRAAYLAASPEGSDPARAPLDTAELQLPALTANKSLNAECRNLTTIAFKEAAVNFTNGIVLQFKIGAVNSAGKTGQSVLGLVTILGMVVLGLGL